MRRAIARRGLSLLAGAVLWLAAAVGVAAAQSRSYFISAVDIAAELRSDGSMRVVEQREFSYTGTYRGAFYTLPLRDGQQVSDFSLRDSTGVVYAPGSQDDEAPGTYAVEQSDDRFEVTWFYGEPAADERRSYTLDYVVTGAGVRHADSSELYWKWVGSGWEVPTSRLEAELRLPEAAAALTPGRELLLWAHGPLTGVVEAPRRGVVRTAVSDLPPETFVEVRVLMPADVLAAAPSDGRQARAAILAEERCLALAADAERARARGERPAADCDPRAALGRLANAGLVVLLLGAGAGWVVLFRRHGREHRLPEDLADYE
ncbi:MAG TPA: DUF2207 domain-containing protein, partial [Egibacteraceae bacterium]|nr:DUF2207 domain-containing protein [Egibacteraceae bacterium]